MIYCTESPAEISFGFLNTLIKSSAFNAVPIIKRIMINNIFKILMLLYSLKTHLKEFE